MHSMQQFYEGYRCRCCPLETPRGVHSTSALQLMRYFPNFSQSHTMVSIAMWGGASSCWNYCSSLPRSPRVPPPHRTAKVLECNAPLSLSLHYPKHLLKKWSNIATHTVHFFLMQRVFNKSEEVLTSSKYPVLGVNMTLQEMDFIIQKFLVVTNLLQKPLTYDYPLSNWLGQLLIGQELVKIKLGPSEEGVQLEDTEIQSFWSLSCKDLAWIWLLNLGDIIRCSDYYWWFRC